MSLIEFLVAHLGSAVAKSILKFWAKDSDFAQNAGGEIIDFLKSKVSEGMASRRGQRQFEAIAEDVAESLLPVFAHEKLGEESQKSVAAAVGNVLRDLRINAELLVKKNLDPTELSKLIKEAGAEQKKLFSADEGAFFDRLADECAQYILDISSQLPNFTEKTFAEVLQRENEIHGVAKAILQEVRAIREKSQTANPDVDFARFEAEYRRAVVRKLDEVELFGVDVTGASRRHRLSVAYISLSASGRLPGRQPAFPLAETGAKPPGAPAEERLTKTVDEVLAGAERLLIRGEAGSGKTTLVKWVAVQCAAQKLAGGLANLNDRVPLVVFLRQCANAGLPAPENFVRHLVPMIADKMPNGWVHRILDAGRAVVLIDGVDEVPQLERRAVYQWIKELAKSFEQVKFVVTSRPPAVNEGWLAGEGFAECDLEPMDLANIHKFLEHWHRAVREELQAEEEKAALPDLESSLRDLLKQNRPIRNLATSPLLCATICALHRDRKKQIPAGRLRLYDACCEMLLERRGKEQQLAVDLQYALSYEQKLVLLQDLAYHMIKNEVSVIAFADAERRFAAKIANFDQGKTKLTAAAVREFLVERSGLLRAPVATKIDFVHRTFQEFLAAKAAVDENDLGLLRQNATNDQWRGVIVLAVGHAPRQTKKELIANLLERGDQEQAHRHQLHFLAVACLETAIDVDADLREQVNQRVAKLLPPKKLEEAKAIALAGDLAAPLLAYKENLDNQVAVACVQALKLINSEAARSILSGYGKDSRAAVVREMAKDVLDDALFRREVLVSVKDLFLHVPVRDLMRLESVRQLGEFPQLRWTPRLDLSGCDLLQDLSGLPAQLPELTTLLLNGCTRLKSLAGLPVMPKLERLDLGGCAALKDLRDLPRQLPELTTLHLRGFTGLKELSELPTMPKLRSLDLCGCTGLKDLSGLPALMQPADRKPIKLRNQPQAALSVDTVKQVLQEKGFYDVNWNSAGKGMAHIYVGYGAQEAGVVTDYATGLMWQQAGSRYLTYAEAEQYVRDLNAKKFAGYNDWRLPTLEEAMSLMEPKQQDGLYLDPVFDRKQWWIWTADKADSAGLAWVAGFGSGYCSRDRVASDDFVRVVR